MRSSNWSCLLINGDTVSADPLLAVMDGILKQATSNVVDAAGTPISKTLLQSMLKTLPSEHLRDKKAMRFLTRHWLSRRFRYTASMGCEPSLSDAP